MQQNLIENDIKCKIHGENIVLYNQDDCENFQSRLYCLSCLDNKSSSRVIKLQKVIEQMNEHKQQQTNASNALKQEILKLQEQFYQQFLLFKKNLESQLNQVQLQYQDWVEKIKNYEGAMSDKCSLVEQLESFSNEQYQNGGYKKEIQEINISQYQQMNKLLDDFNFQDNQDQLKGVLQNVFNVFKIESLEDRIELKPIKYSQKQSSFINVVCQEHNIYIQNIDLEENFENVKQRLKCAECKVGKAVSVTKFFEIYSKLKEVQNKVINDKRQIIIKQINQVQQYFIQVRKRCLQQLNQFMQELDLSIITEMNQQAQVLQRQVECLKEEDIISMIHQILNCENQNKFQDLTDLESRQSATNSIIMKNSTQINEIIINQQSCLIALIKQTSDELEQQTSTYQEKIQQISDFWVQVREQDIKVVEKQNQIKQSILDVKQELLSYQSSFKQLQEKLNEVQIETKSLEEKFSNQDQKVKNISDQNQNEKLTLKSTIEQLSQKIDSQVETIDKKEKENNKQIQWCKSSFEQQQQQLNKVQIEIEEKFSNQNQQVKNISDQNQNEQLSLKSTIEQLSQKIDSQVETMDKKEKENNKQIQLCKSSFEQQQQQLNKVQIEIEEKFSNQNQQVKNISDQNQNDQLSLKSTIEQLSQKIDSQVETIDKKEKENNKQIQLCKSSFEQQQQQLNRVQIETQSQYCKIEEKFNNQDYKVKNISDQNQNEQHSLKSTIKQLSQKIDSQVETMDKKEKESNKQLQLCKSQFEKLQQQLNRVQIETQSQYCKIEKKFSNQDQNIKNISDQNQNEQLSLKFMIGQLSQKIDQQVEIIDKKEKETIKQLDLLKNGQKSSIEQLSLTKIENQEQRVEKIKNALYYLAIFHFNYKLVDSSQVQDNYSSYYPYGMTFNYKGDLLISSYYNQIQIRGFKNQALTGVQSTLQAQSNYIYVIVSSRKYNWFFTGGYQGYISSYKEVNGQWQATHQKVHTSDIFGVLLNKEENQLVTCSADKTIKIWKIDYNTNQIVLEYTLEQKHNHQINCICFNFNESQIVSADKLIIIWEKGNNNKWSFKQQIKNQYIGFRVQFISDTQFALTVYEKGIIQVFNQVNGQYTKIQSVQLTYDVNDGWYLFNSIYLQQQQVLISKHYKYVYFLKKCNVDGKLKIISTPIDSLHSASFGAVTKDGQYLVLENASNGQFRVYALENLNISDI